MTPKYQSQSHFGKPSDSRNAYKSCHSERRLCGVKNLQFPSAPNAGDKQKMEILRSADSAANELSQHDTVEALDSH